MGLLMALCPRLGRCAAGVRLRTFRSGLVLWACAHLSLGGAWARRGSPGQQAKEVSANAGGELAVRTGRHGAWGATPQPSAPARPGGTARHAAAHRPCQPSPPATAPHSQPRHLACPPLPAHCGGRGRGQVPPGARSRGRSPAPTPGRLGAHGGGRRALHASGERRVTVRAVPAGPRPPSLAAAHGPSEDPHIPALHLKSEPGGPGADRRPSPPRPAPALTLHCQTASAWERPGDGVKWLKGTPGLEPTCSPRFGPLVGNQVPFRSTLAPTSLIWSMVMLVASVWLGVLLGV